MFGGPEGEFQDSFKTAWESLLLRANGFDITRAKKGARVGREKLREIDLHWHDLRHYADSVIMPRRVPEAPESMADPWIEHDGHAA